LSIQADSALATASELASSNRSRFATRLHEGEESAKRAFGMTAGKPTTGKQ